MTNEKTTTPNQVVKAGNLNISWKALDALSRFEDIGCGRMKEALSHTTMFLLSEHVTNNVVNEDLVDPLFWKGMYLFHMLMTALAEDNVDFEDD